MGSVLEGAAALIIFGPLLVPVAAELGIAPLHYGVVLVIAMGIGLFAPPLGLGLYGACLIGNVPIEVTVKPMLAYLGLLLLCLLVIAFVPGITLWLPQMRQGIGEGRGGQSRGDLPSPSLRGGVRGWGGFRFRKPFMLSSAPRRAPPPAPPVTTGRGAPKASCSARPCGQRLLADRR